MGVCSAQGTGRGERFDWRIEVEQCDSSAIVLEEEITREMGGKGGGLDRVSRAGRANSSEREREGEGESVANKRTSRRNDDGEKEETIARLFFLDSKGNDTGIRRAIVGSRRSI